MSEETIDDALRADVMPELRQWATKMLDGLALPSPSSAFGINIVENPSAPPNRLYVIGTCSCGHHAATHDETGCIVALGPTTVCQCPTPRSRLVAVVEVAE